MENGKLHPENNSFGEQSPTHPWLEQEARLTPDDPIDPDLLSLLEQREIDFDKLADRPINDEEIREDLKQIHRLIHDRKLELGINPLTHPDIDPPPPSSQE